MFEGLKRFWKRVKTEGVKATLITDLFGGILKGLQGHKLFDYSSYLQAGSRKCWALFKSADLIGKVGMDTLWRLQRKGGDGTAVVNADLQRLLTLPNERMTFREMIYLAAGHLLLTGNAFWLKDETNFNNDRPAQLYPLNPKRIRIITDKDNKGQILGYIYRVEGIGDEVPYEVDEIVHFRWPHFDNDHWGLGVVEAGEDLFQGFLNRQSYESLFWKNGASPASVLACEEQIANKEQWEEMKERFHKQYGGLNNSGKTAWLTGKWSVLKIGLSNVEMQHIEGSRFTLEMIFILCGIPLSVAGLKDAANYATADKDDLRFRRYTVKPVLTNIQETITSDIVAGFAPNLEFIFEIAGLIDMVSIRENVLPCFDRGAMTPNELRVMMGLKPKPEVEALEMHYMNAGLVPVELAGLPMDDSAEEGKRIVNRFVQTALLPAAPNGNGKHAVSRT